MTPLARRMRRARDVAASGEQDFASGFDLYNIQGDSRAARHAFLASQNEEGYKKSWADEYNHLLLRYLEDNNVESTESAGLLQQLDEFEEQITDSAASAEWQPVSERSKIRNQSIMAYNRALALFSSGEIQKSIVICNQYLQSMVDSGQKPPDELAPVLCRLAFLLLECYLKIAEGRKFSFQQEDLDCPTPLGLVEWLDSLEHVEQDAQLKFLLALYKGRVDLAQLDDAGKNIESNVRSARKELKTAMEVFQHKLRAGFGADTASVVSSANSEENASTNYNVSLPVTQEYQQQPPPSSTVLQKYNQSALNLKANLEQLKRNTKKSLILCTEAEVSAKDDGSYHAIHSNNHAVVYETNDKRHLALHALSKALRASQNTAVTFHKDGTARPDVTLEILHNSAVCALQARHYLAAYECMAAIVTRSSTFRDRSRCWLRMAEACIGLFSKLIQNQPNKTSATTVVIKSEPHGVAMESSCLRDDSAVVMEHLVPVLGCPADMEQVKRNPLLRARFALRHALQLANQSSAGPDVLASASLSLAYVSLAFRQYDEALKLSLAVLDMNKTEKETKLGLYSRRQIATARMYAAEAYINLGETVNSMKRLVCDGRDDAFDRLASDIAGVTLEAAAVNEKGKRRLAKTQAMVRSSACAVSAAMGNVKAAKQLANSANAMEDAYASNRERSSARRALIYALLKDGHQAPALNMLISLR